MTDRAPESPADRQRGPDAARQCPDGGTSVAEIGIGLSSETATWSQTRRLTAVAVREYRIVYRAGWTLGLTAAFTLFAAGVVALGATGVGPTRPTAIVVTLAELAVYLVPLAALALGYGTVVGADERGALEPVLALPVPRWTVLAGMYLGRAAAFAGACLLGFGVGGVLFVRVAGASAWSAYAVFVGATLGTGLVFLAVGVLVSTLARAKTRALGAALVAWAWFVLAHDLAALGAVVALDLPDAVLSALVLANPADLLRVLVLGAIDTGAGGFAAVLASTSLSPPIAAGGLVAWCVLPLAAATIALGRR